MGNTSTIAPSGACAGADEGTDYVCFIFCDGDLDFKPCCASKPRAPLVYPSTCSALRRRVLEHEWDDFALEVSVALHHASLPMGYCLIPGVGHIGFALCNLSAVYCINDRVRKLNALYEVLARFNKYLFYPRGMLVSRSMSDR